MTLLLAYSRLYFASLAKALRAIGKSAWTVLLPMGLLLGFTLLAGLVAPLGLIGGLILALAQSAAMSAYMYFVGELVAGNKANLSEFKRSIGVYFWSFINLFFVLWIAGWLIGNVLSANPRGPALMTVITFMELLVLNAAPEVITFKHTSGGIDTITRSVQFLQENWIEWFIPNGLVLGGVWALLYGPGQFLLARVPFGAITLPLLGGALFHVLMVYRGHLFEVLDSTSHRQRLHRFRAPGAE